MWTSQTIFGAEAAGPTTDRTIMPQDPGRDLRCDTDGDGVVSVEEISTCRP